MRVDNLQFKAANEALAQSPRYVVVILFDVGSLYITSDSDIPNVPGIVLQRALLKPSAISQRIIPDEGRSEIGTFAFDVVDLDSDFTDEVRAKLAAGAGLRHRKVQLWCGFKGFDFSAFQLFQTQVIRDCAFNKGVYTVNCEDVTREQRTNILDVKTTTLSATCDATTATIQVADTSKFLPVKHGAAWSDGPNGTFFYFKVEKEAIRATGKTATTFTGCTRGVMNTLPAVHTVDPASPQERRPKVEEFTYLDLPAPKLALAILTGGIFNTWPANYLGTQGQLQTDSNADGSADGWAPFIGGSGDASRVQAASLVAGSSPFSGNAQRLAITSVTNTNDSGMQWSSACVGGLPFTLSGHIRTNATGVHFLLRFNDATGTIVQDTVGVDVASDSIAHFSQLTARAPATTHSVTVYVRGINAATEFLEFDNVMLELGSVAHTHTTNAIEGLLPEHWHVGMAPESVRFADFTVVGADLWDLASDANGFTVRFEGLGKTDGKRFLEQEIYLLMGSYSPIYSDGTVGLRRLPAMVSDAAPVATITEREVVSHSELLHDLSSMRNQIHVMWGFDLGRGDFTRDSVFIDATSAAIHGTAEPIDYKFRGLHSGIHTDNMIRTRLDAVRDAYSYPPQRITVDLLSTFNRYETGDVLRVKIKNVHDFAGNLADIDRSFVVLRRSIDFTTGKLSFELMGSTLRPEALAPSFEGTAPLADSFYTSTGVALSTLVGMTGNNVNVGTHTITGNASMLAAGAVVYHNGDLVVPNGATINISQNVQMRVRGFITLNGTIAGTGGGVAGVADPGPPPALTDPIKGNPGFIGNARGWDGIDVYSVPPTLNGLSMKTIPVALTEGKFAAWPTVNLEVGGAGTTLIGIPSDLRGTGGGPGGRTILSYSLNQTDPGGTGGAGGAGLVIICRGMSFGVSSVLSLNGANTANPVVSGSPIPGVYPGAGAAGGPGACLILMDGNALLFPNAQGRFQAKTGTITQAGIYMRARKDFWSNTIFGRATNPDLLPFSGYPDEAVISNFDMSIAALRIQYIPSTQTPANQQDQLPSPITALAAVTGLSEQITIRATLPAAGSYDQVEYYAAISNNRAGAVLIAKGRMSEFQHDGLAVLQTKYFWARTTRLNSSGIELFSDWFPVSPTGGVTATTSNQGPVGVYFDGFESPWENSFANIANAGGVVITYPSNGQFGGKVIKAQNQLWIQSNFNIPFDPNSLYRITTRIRRTASGGGSNENVYCGVSGVAADGVTMIDEAGGTSASSQHFNCARGFDMSAITVNTWKDHVGYFKGLATSGFGVAPNNEFPTPLRTGVVFFRPVLILNYNSGSGTMECDGIVVERLPTPDDADNSDKARIIPDTEFIRATDQSFWWFWQSGGGTLPSIVLTGGNYGGYCNIPGNGLATSNWIVSRRKTFYQAARGQIYTVTIRIRDVAGTFNGLATAGLIRHARAYSNSTFDPTPASGLAAYCHGGITIQGVPADWTEYSGIVFVPGVSGFTDGDLPAISAIVGPAVATTGSFDVDMVKVEPGATVPPQSEGFTASNNFSGDYSRLLKNCQFNHATVAGTFTLPTATAEIVNARMYFEQTNAALLTIAVQGGDTLQASPNLTGSRNSAGRYARMYAEAVAVNTWRLYGQYV